MSETTYRREILEQWLDRGLCHGAGDGETAVCLEQAVALCAGLPLTDNPDSCVEPAVIAFGRSLNDRFWSSPRARAKGLRELAFAQLGTAGVLGGRAFATRVAELVIRELVPVALRAIATTPGLAAHREALEAAAAKCETEGTEASAREARKTAARAARAASIDAYAAAAAAAADAADDAARAARAAAADDAADDDDADDADAAAAAAAAAAAYAAYAAYADDADDDADDDAADDADAAARSQCRDEILTRCASIGVRVIREQMPQDPTP